MSHRTIMNHRTLLKPILFIFAPFVMGAIPTTPAIPEAPTHEITQPLDMTLQLHVSGHYHINLHKGEPSITIGGKKESLTEIDIQYQNNILTIKPLRRYSSTVQRLLNVRDSDDGQQMVKIDLTLPVLPEIYCENHSHLNAKHDMGIVKVVATDDAVIQLQDNTSPGLALSIHGNAQLTSRHLKAPNIDATLSGSAQANCLSVQAQESKFSLSGEAKFISSALNSTQQVVKLSGSSIYLLGKMQNQSTHLSLSGHSQFETKHLKTKGLVFKQSGESTLNIHHGTSDMTQGTVSHSAHHNLHQFSTGNEDIHIL